MQKAEENQNHYEKKHLNNINRQLEQDERRRKIENEKIKKKEEAFSNFKKIAKSLPNDLQKSRDRRERSNSVSRSSRDESSISKKNSIYNLKIKKADSNNHSNDIHKNNHERQKKLSSSSLSQSKKHFSFKDLMEIAKHNDVSKPVINNSSADFREAKKALKNLSGRKKYKDDFDDDSDDGNRQISKKKFSKKEIREKPEIKKSKKELLNEQMEKRKKEREMNRKAYDGSKDRVAQERMKLLKSRGIHTPVTSKISQDVTEMVKRMEKINNNNNNNSNNNNNNSKSQSKESIRRSSLELNESRSKSNSKYNNYDKYDDESDDYDSEYEYKRRRNSKRVKKVKGMYEDYEVYDEAYVNNNVSSIIGNIFGYNRNRYRDEDDIDDMEVGYSDVKREEARSLRIAKKEDEEEEELERQRLERAKRRKRRSKKFKNCKEGR
jgi:hypothetical protein